MSRDAKRDQHRIQERRAREQFNVFSRLPAVYAASRTQGQNLLQAAGGLTILEWRVLWDLHESGPMSIRDLAMVQRADHSLLSRALPDMRRRGFVEMQRDPDDKRQMIVALTDAGRTAYQAASPTMTRRRAALRQAFTEDELTEFIGYLDRLEDFLRQPVETLLQKDPAE